MSCSSSAKKDWKLRQPVASLNGHALAAQQRLETGGELGIGDLDASRTGAPFPRPAAYRLQGKLGGIIVPRVWIMAFHEAGLQVQAERRPGPKRRSIRRFDPDRQAEGAGLPDLEGPGNQTVEDLAVGFRHLSPLAESPCSLGVP